MKEVGLKLFAFLAGVIGIVYGTYGVLSFFISRPVDRRSYTNPPVLSLKQAETTRTPGGTIDPRVSFFEEKPDIATREDGVYEVGTFRSFQQYTQEYWKNNQDPKPEVTISRSGFLGREYVSSAIARDAQVVLFYRPKLLVLVHGYGDEATFLGLEESPFALLRGIDVSKKQARETAESFRKRGVPYCAITYAPTPSSSLTALLERTLFPNQWILNKRKPIASALSEVAETRALRVKRLLYDAILDAIDSGFGTVELEAGYLEIETLNHILETLEPLPVFLTDQLFWSTEGVSSTSRVTS